MKEIMRQRHPLDRESRSRYAAVPPDPWRATENERAGTHAAALYSAASIKRIDRRLTRTMIDQSWFRHDERAHDLHAMMRSSLFDSQFRRLDKNNAADLETIVDPTDERAVRALRGVASPAELFTLLADNPELQSFELAKLSHPFDFAASGEMDREIDELLLASGGELLDTSPRYKMKRVDLDIPAAIVLRKQDLMDFPVDGGRLRVVQRRGLLVFDGNDLDDPYFNRLLKNPDNLPKLSTKIEAHLADNPQDTPYGWVQPQATSYYAKYLPTPHIEI